MRLEKCYICSSTVYPGHGIEFVRNDAKVFRFCRSKCRKTFHMKRNPRYLRWTKAYRKSHGKEMAIDSTFEFERKRQRIQRYDRELVGKTIQAIQKVDAVRVKREKDFYKSKMKQAKKQEQRTAVRELEKGINLIEPDILRVKESVRAREPVQQGVALVERDQSNTSN